MIEVRRHERAADAQELAGAALDAIEHGPGVWLGCDVDVPGLYRRQATVALDPLLVFYLDGRRLHLVPHGDLGRALAATVTDGVPGEAKQTVDGRIQIDTTHSPALALWRQLLARFDAPPPELGLYGLLAFDYWRLQDDALPLPDDGRRRAVLMLPRRVLRIDDGGATARVVEFQFPGLAPRPGTDAAAPAARMDVHADDHPPGGHAAAVARGVARLQRGELCSLVLSQTFRRPVGAVDAGAAFARLRRDNPYPAMFFVNAGGGERLFGASPDVQVRADATWVETAPVCGTVRRGGDALDDHAQARELLNSAVDEASLAVCADSDRNDKARVCEPGSVELLLRRRLHFFSTLIHTIDHTRGRRRTGVDAFDIVLAHATPATVTGMPKAAAREAIEAIEPAWRGWYAGAAVHIGADGGCQALTMLRFARLVDGWAEVRTGGSLLADSDPVREEQETQLKAETLFRVLGGGSPRPATISVPAPPARRVHFVDGGDALAAAMREALFQAGARFDVDAAADNAALRVLGDGPLDATVVTDADDADGIPTLAMNQTGLALLQRQPGVAPAALERLHPPQFGRTLQCTAHADGPLATLGTFEVGVYATHRLLSADLPPGWTAAAEGADGRVVAAFDRQHRQAVLLCRPDSVLSQRHAAGRRLLAAMMATLMAALTTPATTPISTTEKESST